MVDVNKTISQLVDAVSIAETDRLMATIGGSSRKVAPSVLRAALNSVSNYQFGDQYLRQTRMRTRQMIYGDTAQLRIAVIGDSWTDGTYWVPSFASSLTTRLGGTPQVGWCGFSWHGTAAGTWVDGGTKPVGVNGSARDDLCPLPVFNGAWTAHYNDGVNYATPAISGVSSSAADAYVRLSFSSGHDTCRLFYAGDGTGVIKYSWDGGSNWSSNVDLSTVGAASVLLTGCPTGAGTLRIAVVSGNVALGGVALSHSSAAGVRVDALGGSGSSTSHWAAPNATTWGQQIAALDPHLVIGLLATNDAIAGYTPAIVAANIATLMGNVRAALPAADLMWIAPAERASGTNTYPMTEYTGGIAQLARENYWAFLDLQAVFGRTPSEYASGGIFPLMDGSEFHPSATTGGRLITDAVLRVVCPSA